MSKFVVTHVVGNVRHYYQCDRITVIDQNIRVERSKSNPLGDPFQGVMGALELRDNPDTFVAGLWGGMAYIANADGKTVGRHDLPDDPRCTGSSSE